VRAADRFPRKNLAMVHEKHTASGKHVNKNVAFPGWVPREVAAEARNLDEPAALGELGKWSAR